MEKGCVHLVGESHKTHGFILYLSNQGFVIIALSCNKFGQEVLTVSFSDSFGLIVEDISKVIVIFLLSLSHLDEGEHQHSAGEEYSRAWSNSSDVLENFLILALNLFEINAQWVEAVIDIIIVSITSYLIQKLFIRN
jgi:hypothetical protein